MLYTKYWENPGGIRLVFQLWVLLHVKTDINAIFCFISYYKLSVLIQITELEKKIRRNASAKELMMVYDEMMNAIKRLRWSML